MVTILVVDDEPVIRKLIVGLLSNKGFNVLDAPGGAKALELVRQIDVALMVTDVMMPEMDGVELGIEVKRLSPRTAILYVTGNPGACVNRLQGQLVLTKPFLPKELVALVEALLRR